MAVVNLFFFYILLLLLLTVSVCNHACVHACSRSNYPSPRRVGRLRVPRDDRPAAHEPRSENIKSN